MFIMLNFHFVLGILNNRDLSIESARRSLLIDIFMKTDIFEDEKTQNSATVVVQRCPQNVAFTSDQGNIRTSSVKSASHSAPTHDTPCSENDRLEDDSIEQGIKDNVMSSIVNFQNGKMENTNCNNQAEYLPNQTNIREMGNESMIVSGLNIPCTCKYKSSISPLKHLEMNQLRCLETPSNSPMDFKLTQLRAPLNIEDTSMQDNDAYLKSNMNDGSLNSSALTVLQDENPGPVIKNNPTKVNTKNISHQNGGLLKVDDLTVSDESRKILLMPKTMTPTPPCATVKRTYGESNKNEPLIIKPKDTEILKLSKDTPPFNTTLKSSSADVCSETASVDKDHMVIAEHLGLKDQCLVKLTSILNNIIINFRFVISIFLIIIRLSY